ncbi:MAG TPA: type I-E CRISPR-associated protein Cas6/Cse3/CasE [Candidatus Bathyarchaeia archaeon]|nr:type I-E CRISPR-associated protein Cas6/Cse3/CasE [Candidatus Bathyarchaeia archaeon]
MYLSSLMINTGDNPDRERPGRRWLRDIYHVHQRLSMAFPSRSHGSPSGFLFRIDNQIEENSPRAIVLVQSQLAPDWDSAFYNAGMLLAAPPEVREYAPSFAPGDHLRFRIRMNLSKKTKTARDGTDLCTPHEGVDTFGRPKSQSKRVAVTWDGDQGETPDRAIRQWFAAKAQHAGFALQNEFNVVHLGWVAGHKPGTAENRLRFRSALLEGDLTVADGPAFMLSVESGLGSAKGFGFGLLSVVRAGGTPAPQSRRGEC